MRRAPLLAFVMGFFFLLAPVGAEAQTRILVDCPTGPPCEQVVLGHIDAVGTARLPWVATVPVPANVCFFVTTSSLDGPAIRSVIAPNGAVQRASDAILTVSPTIAGWYTVQLDTPPPGREQLFNVNVGLVATSRCPSGAGR